jgi:cellobiose transport system substrate-binding protein
VGPVDGSGRSALCLPGDIGPAGIFYRRDLLDKAGVPSDPDRLAKLVRTWDDFYAIGKKVNDPKNKIWWMDTAQGIPYIYFAHKNFFDKDMNIAIDNPTTRRLWATIASSQGPFVVSPLDAEAEQAFNVELGKFLDQNLGVEPTIKAMVDAIGAKTAADRKVVL